MLEHEKLGKIAYEGYCSFSNNKSLISGAKLPEWENLNMEIKLAWISAAQAVQENCK